MKEEQRPFDDKIRSALESLPEPTPPAGGWNVLKKRLRHEGVIKTRKRRYFFFILITGAILSLALWFVRNSIKQESISSLPEKAIMTEEQTNIKNDVESVIQPAGDEIPATENMEPSRTGDEQPLKPESGGSGNEAIHATEVPDPLPNPALIKEETKDISNETIPIESKNTSYADIPVADNSITIQTNSVSTEKSGSGNVPEETQNLTLVPGIESGALALAGPEFMPVIPAGILYGPQEGNPGVSSTVTDNASVPLPPHDVIQSRWRVWIYTAWDWNRYRISAKEINSEDSFLAFMDSAGNLQSTIGIFGGYLATCHIEILTGVRYSQKLKYASNFGNISDNLYDSTFYYYNYNFAGRYLQIPILVNYNFRILNRDFYATAGIIPAFNIPDKNHDYFTRTVYTPAGTRMERVNLEERSVGLSASVGLGTKINIYKGIAVFIEPGWQYALHPVIKHPTYDKMPVNPFINTMSIGAGTIYIFNTRQRTRPSICL